MAPAEDLLHKGKADELFPQQKGEDLMSEKIAESAVMEAGDTVECTIRGCTSFGHQDMDMGMKIDAGTKGLDHSHDSRRDLQASGCVEKL
jgi:hypothetical protein